MKPNASVVSIGSRGFLGFTPKLATTFRATDRVAVYGVVNQALRAPTLNELFRNFRVGNALTSANDQLDPESLTGAEAGVRVTGARAEVRVVGFYNRLADAVTNVTVSSTPALITRQRRNAGTIRAAGAEIEAEWQVVPMLRATIATELVNSVFADSLEPGLAGNRAPQVPRRHGPVDSV